MWIGLIENPCWDSRFWMLGVANGPLQWRHNGPLPISPPGKFCPSPSSRCSTPDDMCRAVYFLARPVSGMRTYSRYADNNFAKMRSRGHVPVGRLRLVEGEYLIDYRLNAARRYRTAHRLKHLHGTD